MLVMLYAPATHLNNTIENPVIMQLNMHYLRTFQAVMSNRSLANAALDLNTSYANVKRIIEAMEASLNLPLFDRSQRGQCEPTHNAHVLLDKASRFLAEAQDFERQIKNIEQQGKTLRIGAEDWFFESQYFVEFYHRLRRNPAYRATVVKIAANAGKQALESGQCDILIGSQPRASRRIQHFELPPALWHAGLSPEGDAPSLGEHWGLYFTSCQKHGQQLLKHIQSTHGGSGRLISASEFQAWHEQPARRGFTAVVATAPAVIQQQARVQWQPLSAEHSLPIHAAFLTNHPYGNLKQVVHAATIATQQAATHVPVDPAQKVA